MANVKKNTSRAERALVAQTAKRDASLAAVAAKRDAALVEAGDQAYDFVAAMATLSEQQ